MSTPRILELKSTFDALYWLEQLPDEQGRQQLCQYQNGVKTVLTPPSQNIGTRINVYGGGSYVLASHPVMIRQKNQTPCLADGVGLTRHCEGQSPEAISHQIISILESNNTQSLVMTNPQGDILQTLHDTFDFYAAPRVNAAQNTLAFMAWDLPHMPWESASIYVGPINGPYQRIELDGYQSQPTWHNNQLYFISDHLDGLGQVFTYKNGCVTPLVKQWPNEYDASFPLWNVGLQTFACFNDGRVALIIGHQGAYHIGVIESGKLQLLDLPFTAFGSELVIWQESIVVSAATSTQGFAIRKIESPPRNDAVVNITEPFIPEAEYIAVAQSIWFPTRDGDKAQAFFYPAATPQAPLIVMSHGGPTSFTHSGYNPKVQHWIEAGFSVLDVNYRGSTGFGRAYWEALKAHWGVIDVHDAIDGAQYCRDNQLCDPDNLFIRGSSAGGYLSLCALANTDIFNASAIYYGVADVVALMGHTHRFEQGYNHWLLGKEAYSPIDRAGDIRTPTLFFHGLKDEVVDISQSERMLAALQANGVEAELVTYPNEGHGFRDDAVIADALARELAFYRAHVV